ncbi:hypothetical protein G6F46_012079 [Rhizopus delemar]|uniref:Uncharacterized protein n=3 Tax=Rhizopus TaxID=4842 RepID=I1CTZ7_RHIO9|nr:hypothetical protein RO3G_16638 [Rhizopus delemar RA 99-880]KAG1458170.1 hypothetical protein G6F55_005495 [Rhizopus delemar]KAG1542937.1 hypothetical protein G6F51_006973 [Rhizopus arrhizus]KAG1496845.1 hypothetical protein G6F54_006191 [Rhizopus delemar]KAG1497374.1 hypothetical protein G6F53_011983 [Rhizopus delemar]|eukprot:EIE91927.1 hypothetical protein RO3G_16638 [Rhizopus delemar RA 99-880]
MGIEIAIKLLEIDNYICKTQIWDTAGEERYKAMIPVYYRNVAGVFIVYDITSRSSFENVHIWLRKIREYTDPTAVIMLVGNKVDLSKSSREVETEEGRSLAEEEGLLFIETSALDATNIDTAFTTFLSKLCSNLPKKPKTTPSQPITKRSIQSRLPRVRGLFSRKEITEKEKESRCICC